MRLKLLFFPLSVMLALFMFIWMIKPEWDDVGKARAAQAQAQKDLQDLTNNVNMIDQAVSEYQSLGVDKQLIQNAIPYESKGDELVAQLYDKAKDSEAFITKAGIAASTSALDSCSDAAKSGMSADLAGISSSSSDGTDESKTKQNCLKSETVTISVSGDYPKVKKFISGLEQMNRFSEISKIQIAKEQPKEGEPAATLTAAIEFTVFYKDKMAKVDPLQYVNGKDDVSIQLITGSLDRVTIASFKQLVVARPSAPITVTTTGKEDIFK